MEENQTEQQQIVTPEQEVIETKSVSEAPSIEEIDRLQQELNEANNKYLRLYAEFENYKKRTNRDKEELIKYGNESLIYELLTVIDNLEMALKHSSGNTSSSGLVQGVEITYKELIKTLEKFGLSVIEADGKPFDPSVHHAMSQIERDDIDENIIIEEYRKGYKLKDKVIRPSLVAVSKKPSAGQTDETAGAETNNIEEES